MQLFFAILFILMQLQHVLYIYKHAVPFYTCIMGTRVLWGHVYYGDAGSGQSICPLNNLNIFQWIIKLCENVCWQNIAAKFDNQPDPMKLFGVMALELAKFAKINRVRSIT